MIVATLRSIRISKNLKLNEVADFLEISPDTLRNYERFKTYPDIKTLKKLLKLYDVDYDNVAFIPEEVSNNNNSGCCSNEVK